MLQYKASSAHNKGNILESWVEVYCVQAFDTKIDKEIGMIWSFYERQLAPCTLCIVQGYQLQFFVEDY